MMIIRYVLFAVASMAVNLLAYVLSPFLAAYSVWKDIDVGHVGIKSIK